jgi:hypothetical protein
MYLPHLYAFFAQNKNIMVCHTNVLLEIHRFLRGYAVVQLVEALR